MRAEIEAARLRAHARRAEQHADMRIKDDEYVRQSARRNRDPELRRLRRAARTGGGWSRDAARQLQAASLLTKAHLHELGIFGEASAAVLREAWAA